MVVDNPKLSANKKTLSFSVFVATESHVPGTKTPGIFLRGFRLLGGRLNPPAVKLGPGGYLPTVYFPEAEARELYRAVKNATWPNFYDLELAPVELAILPLLMPLAEAPYSLPSIWQDIKI